MANNGRDGFLAPDGSWVSENALFKSLTKEEVAKYEHIAKVTNPNLGMATCHPVCRRVWEERGFSNSKNYPNISDEQVDHLNQTLFEVMLDDCRDDEYLAAVLRQHINLLSVEARLEALSSEESCRIELLGFDPVTGKPTDSA